MRYLLFACRLFLPLASAPLSRGFAMAFWRPTLAHPLPPGLPLHPFLLWSLFHFLGIFASRDYGILLLREGTRVVHHTCILPAHFRFPFMRRGDLQAAGIWTDPACRGSGLAWYALQEVRRRLAHPTRTLWYLVREENVASIHLAEKAGLSCRGAIRRVALPGCPRLALFLRYRGSVISPPPPTPG